MRRLFAFSSAALLAIGALTFIPGALQASVGKRFECNSTCQNGWCTSSGFFCSCNCDASGNPSCGCLI